MSKILRALLIATVATGAAAVALTLLKPERVTPPKDSPLHPTTEVDADDLTDEERSLLMKELEGQV